MEIIFNVFVDFDGNNRGTVLITNSHLEKWNIKKEFLYSIASRNTEKIMPFEFMAMEDILQELTGEEFEPSENEMYVLSNKDRCFGAAVLLYKDALKNVADILQDDYYILPSSVHELIIIPKLKSVGKDELTLMVKDVNATQLEPEEILSDHAYFYSRRMEAVYE